MPEPQPRYTILESLGEGGMGRVYLAFDPVLRRQVALKFIRSEDPREAERLLLEARLQAALDHDHIAKVYEVGELDGKPFIAMQAVLGETLEAAGAGLPVEERARLLALVARAVHAAHQQGLVHRDLKPANILVERQDDGSLKPYVLDFGLARGLKPSGMTAAGIPAGTLHYMAPEQLSAEGVPDPRGDVYSLGATLYAVLGGAPPFEGSPSKESEAMMAGFHKLVGEGGPDEAQVSLLRRVMEEEAPPLRRRNAALPKDLETIAAKCLEKDPARRYATALALAEDLERFLRGEPIAARPLGPAGRGLRWARRHRALAMTLAGAALALGALQLWSARSAWQASAAAVRLGGEAKEMENLMRVASLLPRHDLRGDMERIRARMAAVREEMRRAGRRADGPGAYALGRGHLALREFDAARAELEKAWAMGYRTPDVALSMGQTYGELYRLRREEVAGLADPAARERALEECRAQLREPAVARLREALAAGAQDRDYLQALIAFYEDRLEDALAAARAAAQASPGLYEARRLEGSALLAQGRRLVMKGDQPGSLPFLEAAGTAFAKALEVGRSDLATYQSEAMRCYFLGFDELALHRDPAATLAKGREAVERALELDPGDAMACELGVNVELEASDAADHLGQDPAPPLELAQAFAERAITQAPGDHKAWEVLGAVCGAKSDLMAARGQDIAPLVDKGISALEWAVKLAPASANAHYTLGAMRNVGAELQRRRGEDPRPTLRDAVRNEQEAAQLGGNRPLALLVEAQAWQAAATYECQMALSSKESAAAADRAFAEAQSVSPGGLLFLVQRADWLASRAWQEWEEGGDASARAAQALSLSEDALRRDAANALALKAKARAQALQALGGRPASALRDLAAVVSRVEGLGRGADPAWAELEIELLEARAGLELAQGISPLPTLGRARGLLAPLLGLPRATEARLRLVRTLLLEARWLAARRQPPGDLAARAEGLLKADAALLLRPEAKALGQGFACLRRDPAARQALQELLAQHPALVRRYGALVQGA